MQETLLPPEEYIDLKYFEQTRSRELSSVDPWHTIPQLCTVTSAALSTALINLEYLHRLYDVDAKLFKRSDTQQRKRLGSPGATREVSFGMDPFEVIMTLSEARKMRISSLTTLLENDLKPRVEGLQKSFSPALGNLGPHINQFESMLDRLETTLRSSSSYNHGFARRKGLEIIPYVRERIDVLQRVGNPRFDHFSRDPFSSGNEVNITATRDVEVDASSTQLAPEGRLESCARETISEMAALQDQLARTREEGRNLLGSYNSAPLIRERITPIIERYTKAITEVETALSGPLLTWLKSLDAATDNESLAWGARGGSSL